MHTDLAWDSNWQPGLQVLARGLRERGVRLGIICDGNVNSPSDEAWTAVALERCREVNRNPQTPVADFMVQSWLPRPHNMLPEDKPGTLTWLLKQVEAIR